MGNTVEQPIQILDQDSALYPLSLTKRMGKDAPTQLWTIGRPDLLNLSKTAFFCSNRCPGNAILAAMDQAQEWREQGRCIISGFHSPIEKECLQILLRGVQPIIICPARSLERMRIPRQWQTGIEAGRILLLSPFSPSNHRISAKLSEYRNQVIAALADEVFFGHVTPGGRIDRLSKQIAKWGISGKAMEAVYV